MGHWEAFPRAKHEGVLVHSDSYTEGKQTAEISEQLPNLPPIQILYEYMNAILDVKKLGYKSVNDVVSMYSTRCKCLAGLINLEYTDCSLLSNDNNEEVR